MRALQKELIKFTENQKNIDENYKKNIEELIL